MRSVFILLLSAGLCCGAAQKKGGSSDPGTLLTRFRDDINLVMSNPNMNAKDKKKLDGAVKKLDKNIDARAQGKKINPGDVGKALDDVGKVAKTLPEEDKSKLYEDMRNIRDRKLDATPRTRQQRLPGANRNPYPNPRSKNPYPRY